MLCSLFCLCLQAARWTTHFTYNNVTQIAMAPDKVFAISDGSLFSVDKQTEQMRVYNRQSGLHAMGITCIHYDEKGEQLIIAYDFGKMDVLTEHGVQYIGALYDKDMTQRKTIYNITISGRTAYLSTHYGVQTMDLRENKLVDSYWLRPKGEETPIKDVQLIGDSIYAFGDDSLYCAKLSDPLSDYTYWHREPLGRIAPDTEKGHHYQDATNHWYAGYSEGIIRFTQTERLTYKPNGPLQNTPYRLTAQDGMVYMVPGGRWDAQYNTQGCVMYYDGQRWTNVSYDDVMAQAQNDPRDFLNVVVDKKNKHHYYVTSYGTGLYEFRNNELIRHEIAGGENSLVAILPNDPARYTRLDFATYDNNGNLWLLDACTHDQLQCIAADGTWHSLDVKTATGNIELHTPGGLIIDHRDSKRKWISTARHNTLVALMDDHNSAFDTSDDQVIARSEWTNQHDERFKPDYIFHMMQDAESRIWLATEKGVAYIDKTTDFFTSDAIIQPEVTDENGENPITSQRFQAMCQGPDGHIWLGSQTHGVYVLDPTVPEIIAHYTSDNTAMPSDAILSLAYDITTGHVFVGTGDGLVEYDPKGEDEGFGNEANDANDEDEMGRMQQWTLHFSYVNPTELAATSQRIYAAASGSLFSVNRNDHTLDYWNKSTGLKGSSVSHIAYDGYSERLVITYENGQIDLMDNNGNVTTMPELSLKAGAVDINVNSLCVGAKHTYLAMPFGIVVLNTKRGEVSDTYYIGANASSVDIQQVVETSDSLFAFSYDKIYKAALKDNLVDYTFWQEEQLSNEVQQAAVWRDTLYTLQDNLLYRRTAGGWTKVSDEQIQWMNAHDGQLLVYTANGLFRLTGEGTLSGLNNLYQMNNALYSNGEYWVAETNYGLIRLGTNGDDYFHTEGPNSNFGYCMYAAHGQIYSAIGGRWAEQFQRYGRINIYKGGSWSNINEGQIGGKVGKPAVDIVSLAVDPNDAGHFFAATYGTGVYEFKNYEAVARYDSTNSTLRRVNEQADAAYFTRTDGAMLDEQGNFWVLNSTSLGSPLHVRTPNGLWKALNLYSGGVQIQFTTPGGRILPDRRNSRYKWIYDQRSDTRGVILFDDGGTPTSPYDDHCIKRNSWVDGKGNVLSPAFIICLEQDLKNRLWIGTDKGILLIPSDVDFFTSNACERTIIPRNDGTNLADYLLGNEQINCMAVDGGNRMWIGTATSGLYLIEYDTITVAHFTQDNSLLPSNTIQSIAIEPTTGEVFVGTDKGIASYRSDASEPQETMSEAYAYPNPVPPHYSGVISITGLMENTVVNIVDAGGNLVCKTRSHGGTAVWDGKDAYGKRAAPGIYTALCNAPEGHTAVKILVAY